MLIRLVWWGERDDDQKNQPQWTCVRQCEESGGPANNSQPYLDPSPDQSQLRDCQRRISGTRNYVLENATC